MVPNLNPQCNCAAIRASLSEQDVKKKNQVTCIWLANSNDAALVNSANIGSVLGVLGQQWGVMWL